MKSAAGMNHRVPATDILRTTTAVLRRRRTRWADHQVFMQIAVFLHDDGIGARRNRRAGKDPHCLANADAALEWAARRRRAYHLQ